MIYVNIARALLQGRALTDVLSAANCKEPFERITSIAALTEDEIRSTGYVVDTLEAVLWCLTNTDGYKEAVLKAVNLGEDTDTVATLTGGLAGIIYGYDSIPKKWIRDLKGKDIIERYIEF